MTDSKSSPYIIAAMPAFNEERYIGTMVLKTRQYVSEVIVVDDGSRDQTAQVAGLAGATVVRHPTNKGYGATIQSILSEARKRQPDALVLLDADTQHDPAEIPRVVKALDGGFDIVIGSRELQKNHTPFYRKLGQGILLRSARMLSNEDLSDSESGFRVFSRRAINSLEVRENGMAISAETIASAAEKGLRITQVPITVIYTKDSSTLNPIAHGVQVLTRILIMISERRPLFLFGVAGTILAILGLIAGVWAFQAFFREGTMPVLRSVASVFLLMAALFCFSTGIVIYILTNRRPPTAAKRAGQSRQRQSRRQPHLSP